MSRLFGNGRSTVDAGEVERHTNLGATWWDRHGSVATLHSFNSLRIPFIVDFLCTPEERKSSKPLANKKILDVGCGGGLVSEVASALAKLGAEVTGVDPASHLIDLAKEHCNLDPEVSANKPTYLCTAVEEHMKERPEYYDAVVATEVVDHVADVNLLLKGCSTVMKPKAKIFITTPNRTRLSQFFIIFLAENIFKWIPKGLHKIEHFVTPEEVTAILEKYKCQVEESRGIMYYPIIDKFQWVFFQTLWYALVATKQDI